MNPEFFQESERKNEKKTQTNRVLVGQCNADNW